MSYGASLAVFLPTSPDFDFFGSSDGGAVFTAMVLQPERLAAFAPDTTTYRAGLDLRWQGPSTFVQAELAPQLPRGPTVDVKLLTLTVAAGVDFASEWSLIGQVDTTTRLLDPHPSADEENWWFTTSAGLRHQRGNLGFGARLFVPVDPIADNDLRSAGLFVDLSSRF
jgi:hypothetical protein